jgi:nitrogen fixation/metabolism regulation signal transduction histidine kinase
MHVEGRWQQLTAAKENLPRSAPPVDPAALQTLMCRAGLAVAVLDETGRLSMLSPGLEHLLQRTFTAVQAESLAEVFHLHSEGGDRLLEPHEVPIVRASRGEVVEDAIVTVRAPGQPIRHLRVNATPIVGPNGERRGAWAVMTDVTSLVAAARGELSLTLAESVNHNLRTPLTTMLCHAELLLEHQDDCHPDAARSIQAVWRSGQRLKSVVSSISEWIDLAYTPEGEDKGADLTELASILNTGTSLNPVARSHPRST